MTLSKMQNDSESLDLLFLQRMSYRRAKQFRNFFIAIQIFIIAVNVLEYNGILQNKFYFSIFGILFLLSIILMCLSRKYTNVGVITQDYFDRRLFGLLDYIDSKIDIEEIKHRACILKKRYHALYMVQTTNDGKKGGVKDWYTLPGKDERLLPLYCQLENNIWSFYLAKINFSIYVLISGSAASILMVFYWNQPLSALIFFILRYITIIVPFMKSVFELLSMVKTRMELKNKIDNLKLRKNISKEKLNVTLNDIQKQVFDLRKEKYLISEMIYNLFRKRRQDVISEYISTKFEISD